MRSKLSLVVGLLILFSMTLSACVPVAPAPAAAQPTTEAETALAATQAAPTERPKMSFWMNYNFDEAVNQLIRDQVQAWADENNVDIDILISQDTDLHAKWSAALEAPETLPDVSVIFAQWYPKFYDAGVLLDVSDVFAQNDQLAGGFMPAAKEAMTIGGKQYAIPYMGSVTPGYWRTDKLEEAGLSEPPQTYADLLEFCKEVNVEGEFWCYGLALGGYSDNEVQMRNILWSFGASTVKEDSKTVNIDTPETRAALQWLVDMQEAGSFPPDFLVADDSGNNKYYQTRMVAHVQNTGSILSWMRTNDEELLDMTVMGTSPEGPAGKHVTTGYGSGIGAFNTSQYPELAKSLLAHFTKPENVWARCEAIQFGNLPVHVGAFDDPVWDDPYLSAFVEQIKYGHPIGYPGSPTTAAYEVQSQLVLTRMATRLLTGDQTIDETIAQAQTEIEKIYEEFPPQL